MEIVDTAPLAMKGNQTTISQPMTNFLKGIVASKDRVDGGTTMATVILLI